MLSAIERYPVIFRKRLKDQFKTLLLKPLLDTRGRLDLSTLPQVFIIDGLDEVEAAGARHLEDKHEARQRNESDQVEILSMLLEAAKHPCFPFRILIASRPERVIREVFEAQDAKLVSTQIFLDDRYDPDSDIALYVKAKIADVRRRYRLPSSWPTVESLKQLVDKASGQF